MQVLKRAKRMHRCTSCSGPSVNLSICQTPSCWVAQVIHLPHGLGLVLALLP